MRTRKRSRNDRKPPGESPWRGPLKRAGWLTLGGAFAFVAVLPVLADDRRAKAPQRPPSNFDRVFFRDLSEAVDPNRPAAPKLQASGAMIAAGSGPSAGTDKPAAKGEGGAGWEKWISPVSIEDEVKRLKLHFDGVVTTPGPFKGGGYLDARVDLSVLAMLFAVISDYEGEVRWKEESAAARDLLARTAFNSKAGSVQVYNEAKLRKQDLQDLVAGSGLTSRDAEEENDWAMIVDRGPLMQYLDWAFYEQLDGSANTPKAIEENEAEIRRLAEMIAVVGQVLRQEGLDDSDDPDYREMSQAMTAASLRVRQALEQKDADAIGAAIGDISQSCDRCHEQFR